MLFISRYNWKIKEICKHYKKLKFQEKTFVQVKVACVLCVFVCPLLALNIS